MKRLLMGNEAFAHAALEAGCGVFVGYPGTPSSELIETVAKLHASGAAEGIHVEWSTNEKAALEVAAGAAMSGVRALFTCKQVGLNVASDALMSLNYVGVRGGLVLFVADDPGPISSQTEQDTRRFAAFAKVPVLDPATPEQGFEMMKVAFELSERYETPVIVRPTTRIDHASTYIDVQEHTHAALPESGFKRDPSRWVIFPRRSYQAHGEINERLRKMAREFSCADRLNRVYGDVYGDSNSFATDGESETSNSFAADGGFVADSGFAAGGGFAAKSTLPATAHEIAVIAGGDSTMYALEALYLLENKCSELGVALPNWRLLQIGTPYPFPEDLACQFMTGIDNVIVFEELDYVIEDALLNVKGARGLASPRVFGKLTGTVPSRGELSTAAVLESLAKFFEEVGNADNDAWNTDSSDSTDSTGEDNNVNSGNAKSADSAGANNTNNTDSAGEDDNTLDDSVNSKFAKLAKIARKLANPEELLTYPDELPARPPVLCAGCPHRGSFFAVKQALRKMKIPRENAVFCGDIGCYTLGNAMPLDAVDTCLCMGAGMTMAQGFEIASELIAANNARHKDIDNECDGEHSSISSTETISPTKAIAFIGDSTFFASGMTGVANAVYNGIDVTFCVLDNSTTAMTGMQPHPGTGQTLMGENNKPIDIDEILHALGVPFIVHANPLDRTSAHMAARGALEFAGPSAVIFESPCVWKKPFAEPLHVDADACTGCRKCITSIGCPAIGFSSDPKDASSDSRDESSDSKDAKSADRGQATIDVTQCNGCTLCTQVCPFDAIATTDTLAALKGGAIEGDAGEGHAVGTTGTLTAIGGGAGADVATAGGAGASTPAKSKGFAPEGGTTC